jgi:Sulfotransferase domain
MPAELLVTGCYRSGTTLLEKLLHAHPASCVASQPFPVLYAYVKGLFDESRGLLRRYPLSHRFLEGGYSDTDFATFLDRRQLTGADLDAVFEQLARYTWTPEILGARATIRPGVFLDVYRQLMQAVLGLFPKAGVRVIGSKEILVEEYVSYLLGKGIYVVIILRDPRDMITSLNFSERDNATGRDRPVLYSIRIWRKSVATALAFEGHPRFRWLRYEDLVAHPLPVMTELGGFLQLPAFPEDALTGPLRDQRGRDWEGNSSFRDQTGVSRESVGRFREALPQPVQSMIETVAAPEMALLGYTASQPVTTALTLYRDPFANIYAKFPADYSADARRVRDELERLERLTSRAALSDDEARRWFVYPEAYRRLREAVRPH